MHLRSRRTGWSPHPLHAILLAFPIALFTGAVVTDIAYLNTAEIQWSNFSAWMIAGGLLFSALVLLWAAALVFTSRRRAARLGPTAYLVCVGAMGVIGLINAFHHSRDAWSSVGAAGLVMSILCALMALVAGWLLHGGWFFREKVQ